MNVEELGRLQQTLLERLAVAQRAVEQVIGDAGELLRADIEDPILTGSASHPDTFMLRANQAGIALLRAGFFPQAARLYSLLDILATEHADTTGKPKHTGALLANLGTANIVQGKVDEGVVDFFRAAQSDVATYQVPMDQSFAITNLLEDSFAKPISDQALQIVQKVNPALTMSDVKQLRSVLGDLQFAFLAYVHQGWMHLLYNDKYPNLFSLLQLLSALRNLSALLEVQLKRITGEMGLTLMPTLAKLYQNRSWWSSFERTRVNIKAIHNSTRFHDDILFDALNLTSTNPDVMFWKSVLVTYIVRNFTVHQMETKAALVTTHAEEVLGHILNTMMLVPTA